MLLLADDLDDLFESLCWVTCSEADAQVLAGNYCLVQASHSERASRLHPSPGPATNGD